MAKYTSAVIDAITALTNKAAVSPYYNSRAALLHNASDMRYTKYGKEVAVRQVTGGTLYNYDGEYDRSAGNAGSVRWQKFVAPYDRALSISVDALDELNSIAEGMTPSSVLIYDRTMLGVSEEIDATTFATIYAGTKAENRHLNSAAGFKTDAENIISTLLNIDKELKKKKVNAKQDVIVFLSATVYSNLQAALVANNGFASGAVIKPTTITQVVNKEGLEVVIDVVKFGTHMYLVDVPDDLMYSLFTLFDGKSEGQTGGFAKDTSSAGACDIDILAVPTNAAFVDIRHLIAQVAVPLGVEDVVKDIVNNPEVVSELNGLYDGSIALENIGPNQRANSFDYDARIVYGAGVQDALADTIIAVTGPVVA